MPLSDQREVEYKLEVLGDDSAATLIEVAALDEILGVPLRPPVVHRIHDIYWDTEGGTFGARRVTIRLREIDGRLVFTLKGRGHSERGLFERDELEIAADPAGWQLVRSKLMDVGITLSDRSPATPSPYPRDWMSAAGLKVTQDRETERVVRLVGVPEAPIAELALDTVTYHFGKHDFVYREIEVEQLQGSADDARRLGEAMLAHFPGRLIPARMGKYSRGLQIERRLHGSTNRDRLD